MKSFSMVAYSYLEKIKNFNDRSSEFIDYMTVAATYNLITSFTGFSCFISYFYILSFFQNSKGLKVIWGTLSQALYKLLFFFLVFILVFIGWVLLAYKGFGQYLEEYRNIGSTSTTLLKMLLGTVNFDQIYNVQPEFAGIFFFLFIFLNYFVMLNVFLAIINESYETIYSKIKTSDTDEIFIMLGMMMSGLKYALWTIPWNIILFRPCRSKRSV
jgi:polycystin 2